MALTNANARKLNKMNTSACETGLGDELQRVGVQAALVSSSGSLLATGSEVNLSTGITQKGYIVQCRRSGSAGTIPLYVTSTTGNLKVTSASGAAALTTTDTITWIAFE
jgi:hypothetical protein